MLKAERVAEILQYGLFKDEELKDGKPEGDFIKVAGIVNNYVFHPRIKDKKDEIQNLINELNPTFKEGWSFLNLPFDKNDRHWGEHINCEQLCVIARAVDLAEFQFPRDMWEVLPGGMPYVKFEINSTPAAKRE